MKENGKRQTINSMKYHAEQIQEKLHIYFKYHFLRHTYGTALADRNTPVHTVQSDGARKRKCYAEILYRSIKNRH